MADTTIFFRRGKFHKRSRGILINYSRVQKGIVNFRGSHYELICQDNGVENSGLAFINVDGDCPFSLFQGWRKEARHCGVILPDALTLATCNRDAKVTARTVILRRVEADGFVIMTDRRSRKSRDLEDVPSAAMVFLWCYVDDDGKVINRQVRVEGPVKELQPNEYQDLYDREPLYCKIRSHICHQGQPVDWMEQKQNHDELFDKVHKQEQDLPMPDHFIAYKLTAEVIEFYYAFDKMIGDRVLFALDKVSEQWNHQRIAA